MSRSSSLAPLRSTGAGYEDQCTTSELVAKRSLSVVHPPATFTGYTAQYSLRDGIHSTSMCHAKPSGSLSDAVCGPDHCIPTLARRSSTFVVAAPHPLPPALTLHMSHSVELLRTIVGEMIRWFSAL